MRKAISTFSFIFLIQTAFLFLLGRFFFQNQFFIPSIIISLSSLFLIGLISIIILIPLYQAKINQKLINVQNKNQTKHTYPFDQWYKRFKLGYFLLFLLPLCLVLYIEFAPKRIYTVDDFDKIEINPDGHYKLMNDLDLSNRKQEIEYYTWCSYDSHFNGILDGNNKTLDNVNQPLFFCTSGKAVIKDLTLKNVAIKARYAKYTGVISNVNYGLVNNVHIEGNVTGYQNTGGIVGSNDRGRIMNSSFIGQVNGLDQVGGIAGSNYNFGTVKNSYVKGTITGQDEVGGLIGNSNVGTIDATYVKGTVSGRRGVGGLVGFTQMTIMNSYTVTEVISTNYGAGGISGQWGQMVNVFSLGNTIGKNGVGGISGDSRHLEIENCFAYGDIRSNENQGYGLVFIPDDPVITNSFQYEHQLINEEKVHTEPVVTKEQLLNINWYREVLKLDEVIWDLSLVENGFFPQLKDLPNQDKISINKK